MIAMFHFIALAAAAAGIIAIDSWLRRTS